MAGAGSSVDAATAAVTTSAATPSLAVGIVVAVGDLGTGLAFRRRVTHRL